MKAKIFSCMLIMVVLTKPANLHSQANNTSYYPDNQSIGGDYNTGIGKAALSGAGGSLSGKYNTAVGFQSLYANQIGEENTAMGMQSLNSNIQGTGNSAFGHKSLFYLTNGNGNTAIGRMVLHNTIGASNNTGIGTHALFSNTWGVDNVSAGAFSLYYNVLGERNVAIGASALHDNVDGIDNVAVGNSALYSNTTSGITGFVGFDNIAVGSSAMFSNIDGQRNVAVGNKALWSGNGYENSAFGHKSQFMTSTGIRNTSSGAYSLYNNGTGNLNVAEGYYALYNNVGSGNTASGAQAMIFNTSGGLNVAVGNDALKKNTTGSANTAIGFLALGNNEKSGYNVAVGFDAMLTNNGAATCCNGWFNTAVGVYADVNTAMLTNATALGYNAVVDQSNKVFIGDANVAINDVWSYGQFNTISDGRFKTNVSEDDVKGLAFIKLLRPVVYNLDAKKATEFMCKSMPDSIRKLHTKGNFDEATAIRQSGFIAQEVEKAAKASGYNFDGVSIPKDKDKNMYGIGYAEFVVPLVKAVQEQQQIIEKQNADHSLQIQDLQKQLEEQKQLIQELKISTSQPNGIKTIEGVESMLGQNDPNPFSTETIIKYALPKNTSSAYVAVYDLSGKQITTFPIKKENSSITINSDKLVTGIYIYSIIADNTVLDSKRMIVTEK